MKGKKKKILFFTLLSVAIILILFWSIGLFRLWTKGIASVADDTHTFNDKKSHILNGESSIAIDLSKLESNIGKELYNDGHHKIYVSWIHKTSEGYEIFFRSCGQYSISKATLISGIQHVTLNEKESTDLITAKMKAHYNGKSYISTWSKLGGINFKDGDEFSFYIFPYNAYETKEVTLDEEGIVYLSVTNLYKNIWSKN
ncbi:hypothetical protein [Rummeliibacillus pycnus]|uniref:hypothetical protein n=1 Tax=Rummeliibacillus pycnus TaxID=101070 RepID=UPI003D267487